MYDRRPPANPATRWRSLQPRRRTVGAVAALVVLAAVAAVIGGSGTADRSHQAQTSGGRTSGAGAGAGDVHAQGPPAASIPSSSASEGTTGDAGRAERSAIGASIEPKVIRTGSIEVTVARGRFTTVVTRLSDVAVGVGGFVSASETSQLGDDPRGTVTLRVPARDFDRVLVRIGDLGKVRSATTGSQDVTGEYTDVAARIQALQDEREQIRLVLGRAQSIPDILAVRDRLSAVQGELEQLQGRKQVLADQTSLSTITVQVSEQGGEAKPLVDRDEHRGLAAVWHDSADRFAGGARAIVVGLAALAPWLLLLAVVWLPARWLWRRSQADVAARPAQAAATPGGE